MTTPGVVFRTPYVTISAEVPVRVFTPREIEERRIPNVRSFARARDELTACIRQRDEFWAAAFLGSVLHGKVTPASDIDLLVVPRREAWGNGAEGALQHLHELTWAFHIKLQLVVGHDFLISTGASRFTPCFRTHILWAIDHGGLVQGNEDEVKPFFKNVRPDLTIDVLREDMRSYIGGKIERLLKMHARLLVASDEERYAVAEEILSTPIHVMRKVLQVHDPNFDFASPKNAILDQIAGLNHGRHDVITGYVRTLREYLAAYALAIRGISEGTGHATAYFRLVEKILTILPETIRALQHLFSAYAL